MANDLVIIRNVLNPDLLKRTEIKYEPQLLVDGRNGLFGQQLLLKLFVENRIQDKYGFVCLIDEDCLLYDIQHTHDIISYMKENSIDIMGVPDGGMLKHRTHRPDVPNLFFVVIDTAKLKNLDWDELRLYPTPQGECTSEYAYDNFEPYYKTLCYMNEKLNYNFVPLEGKGILDDRTTEVYFNGQPICLHTWFARKYNVDIIQTKRINKAITYGLSKQKA